jgi:DNA-directed RNA polymerase subunit M/transcription elongation factor TFIIS
MANSLASVARMVSCQNCGKNLTKPDRKIENDFFCIAVYTCDKCGANFKIAY